MPINDLPKSLVDSVIDVVTQSAKNEEKLFERIIKEGLNKFGISDVSSLSENDVKALYAWTQIRLNEVMCSCGGELDEDDMPNDAEYHKGGDEEGEKKKEIDEEDDEKKDELKEAIALGPDEIATNGAVGVGDASIALPIHADVITDSSPLDNPVSVVSIIFEFIGFKTLLWPISFIDENSPKYINALKK